MLRDIFIAACAAASIATNAGCSDTAAMAEAAGAASDAGEGVGAWHPFFVLIAFTRATPVPRTPAQQVEDSAVIAKGFLDDVADGRVIDYATGASNPLQTAVFRIRIESVVKGGDDQYAYAEFIRGGIPIDRMEELLPRDVPMVFLLREPGSDSVTYEFQHEGRGLPAGARLLALLYPSGIALDGEEGIDYPLAEDPFEKIFEAENIDELLIELSELEDG